MTAQINKRTIVYRNLKTGEYFVQPYTIGPIAASEFGEPTVIQSHEIRTKIADAVLNNLDKFGKESYDRMRAIVRNDKQQMAFLKEHLGVSVSQGQSGELVIYALHREGGGMVGSDEDTFVLSKEEIPHKLAATIAEAFRRAT
jgi:hypothetical protein